MVDLELLRSVGTTNERLREFFTAELPADERQRNALDADTRKKIEADMAARGRLEERIGGWLNEHIAFSLMNHHHYSAVDLAWDSAPINKRTVPLMLYAQGRIDVGQAVQELTKLPDGQNFIKRNDAGSVVEVDLPRFFETHINLIRSVITRRLAAQVNKYNTLFPWMRYESRSPEVTGRLRADLVSQRMDIMADQFNYRHLLTQAIRDMLLYGRSVIFPRAAWEREIQWQRRPAAKEFDLNRKEAVVVKEGIGWCNPHPGRVFYDNAYPITSLNTDTGCEYVGFWDVVRERDVRLNPAYFKRAAVNSAPMIEWLSTYATYFREYFNTLAVPSDGRTDLGSANDRKNNVGLYGEAEDASLYLTELFLKVRPNELHWGNYPYPVWVHLKVAGNNTVVFAEIMPSSPAVVFSFNENDNRLLNLGLAHELMPFQDQLTNLFTDLLDTIKQDLQTIRLLNESAFIQPGDNGAGQKVLDQFRRTVEGNNWRGNSALLSCQFEKMRETGIDLSTDNVMKVIQSPPSQKITEILQGITTLIAMADRLMVMSAHEQGQSEPREITATQSQLMASSTASVYTFVSDAVDEGRAAWKRISYESLVAFGSDQVYLPVLRRYPDQVVLAAGFEPVRDELGGGQAYFSVRGPKAALVHDYIFTVRDGAERTGNTQASRSIIELIRAMSGMAQPVQEAIWGAMGKEKVYEIFNLVFQLADIGVDLKLELDPGEDPALLPGSNAELMDQLKQMAEMTAQNSEDLAMFKQALGRNGQSQGGQGERPGQ